MPRNKWCLSPLNWLAILLAMSAAIGWAQEKKDAAGAALEQVNYYRKLMGLKPVRLNAQLNKAAQLHADYVAANWPDVPNPHEENSSKQGFIGAIYIDRIKAAGYNMKGKGSSAEDVALVANPQAAVDIWVGSVYHRIPIANPLLDEIGYGLAQYQATNAKADVMEFVFAKGAKDGFCAIYPVDNQIDVPTMFGDEGPNPRPDGSRQSGYPITITFGIAYGETVKCTLNAMVDSQGKAVDYFLLTPENDVNKFLHDTVALIPKSPLAAGEKYTVMLAAKPAKGKEVKKTFSFTAGGNAAPEPANIPNAGECQQYFTKGKQEYDAGKYEDAISSYTKAIEIFAGYSAAYFNRGNAEYALERYEVALADFQKVLELDPSLADIVQPCIDAAKSKLHKPEK